jgi:DNA replication protein DnaC
MTKALYPSQLEAQLKAFRLFAMAKALESRLQQAEVENLSHAELLELLCEDEATARADNKRLRLYKGAKLPWEKDLSDFDFDFQPSINRRDVLELAAGQFLKTATNILFVGPSGVGKTHLSIAIALSLLEQERTVLFTTVWDMINKLQQARADLTYQRKIQTYIKPDLLILDELGYRSMAQSTVEDFFEIISHRHEKGSVIITSNRPVTEWDKVFVDTRLASAIVDRLQQHNRQITITGESWRRTHRD